MICSNCKCEDIDIQVIEERKKAGLFLVLWYIFLAMTVLGLFILIPMLMRKKTKTVTYAVCKNCGKRWQITDKDVKKMKAPKSPINPS